MGVSQKWFKFVRGKFLKSSSNRDIILPRKSACSDSSNHSEESILRNETFSFQDLSSVEVLTKEDIAAIKIQAHFRGHLARRAYRALRSLVKLQALARGVYVRNQVRIALDCMRALVRLQVRVRARQLLGACNHDSRVM
ncbi:hypothetical protein L6164_027582 [Bauhinia variegata]|uniref:Uncharacterized protein n=1 Tax=Bauhinia variegata TaxID=167791 RepID=A0ACB9LTV8_BAUVA|nr:hypothetical protein L6164_027582 [Bauhinia variegata]